jgi:TRAP-type C4-dicarboxylate transport system permease small subunit
VFKTIEKGIHWASRFLAIVSMVVLFLMVVFIGADVVGRFAFQAPIPGSIDFVTVMMVVLIFPVMGYVTQQDGHVRTDLIYEKLSKRGRGICNIPTSLLGFLLVGYMGWRLWMRSWSIIQNPPGVSTSYFQWPHLPFMIIAMVGLTVMALEILIQFFRAVDDAIHG